MSILQESRQMIDKQIISFTEENKVLINSAAKTKRESDVIKLVSTKLSESNEIMSDIIKTEQNLKQAEMEAVIELEEKAVVVSRLGWQMRSDISFEDISKILPMCRILSLRHK